MFFWIIELLVFLNCVMIFLVCLVRIVLVGVLLKNLLGVVFLVRDFCVLMVDGKLLVVVDCFICCLGCVS